MLELGKIGVIGVGKMGEALISGLASSKFNSDYIYAYDIVPERAGVMKSKYNIHCCKSIPDLVSSSDIIALVVKPQDILNVVKEVGTVPLNGKIVLSLAAGITTSFLAEHLPKGTEIVRAMPNLACAVGEGMVCICRGQGSSKESLEKVRRMFELTGRVLKVDEKYMDAVTGLSGSGPAFTYVFIEALADAGVRLGLRRDDAFILAAQTVLGAGKLVVATGEHPAKLRDMVVTPGGTTIEGLLEIEKGGVRAVVIEAVSKAAEKARQLRSIIRQQIDPQPEPGASIEG